MEMEVWEEAVSPKEEEQFCFIQVEFEVVSSHPSTDVPRYECVRGEET